MPFSLSQTPITDDLIRNYFTMEDQMKIGQIAKDIMNSMLEQKEDFQENIDKKNGRYYYARSPIGDFLGIGSLYATTQCKFAETAVGSTQCTEYCKDFVDMDMVEQFVVCKKCFERKKDFEI